MTAITRQYRGSERSREVRGGRREVREELRAGLIAVADAIHDERAGIFTVYDFIRAQPGIGQVRARRICLLLHIGETRRLRELTLRQKGLIVAEVLR